MQKNGAFARRRIGYLLLQAAHHFHQLVLTTLEKIMKTTLDVISLK
jgi:hypothetical protein